MWKAKARRASFFLSLLCLLLAGCVSLRDPEASFEYTGDLILTLDADTQVSQTLVSRRAGLNGLQLWLRPASAQSGEGQTLQIELYRWPEDGNPPLTSLQASYSQIESQFPLSLSFPAQNDPPGQAYRVQLSTSGPPLALYGRDEDGYPDGSLYVNGSPRPADLAFRASYEYAQQALVQDARTAVRNAWLTLPLLLLLWVPGRLALELAALGRGGRWVSNWDWSSRQALSVGLSLALAALGLLWTTTLGWRWRGWSALAAALLAGIALALLAALRRRRGRRLPGPDRVDLALLALFGLGMAFRLAMVRDLAAPAWVDPIHHTLIAHLIVEGGMYPASYAPYVVTDAASYHPGFHGLVAGFHWLSGMEISRAMLLLGQVLNALIIPAAYLLAAALAHDRLAGLGAGLIAGFATSMPAYYVSWGRYTQLAGLIVLPAGAALLIRLLERGVFQPAPAAGPPRGTARLAMLSALAGGGLLLIHYRVLGFLALLMLAVYISKLVRSLDKLPLWISLSRTAVWIGSTLALGVLCSLPWWPELYDTLLAPALSLGAPQPELFTIDWGYLTPAYGKQALWLALAGLLIAIVRAHFFGPGLALWVGLLFIAANQGVFPFPLAGQINKSSVEIMLFMPIAVLGGYALSSALRLLGRLVPARLKPAGELLAALGMLYVCWLGIRQLMPIINPATLLFQEADRRAMNWIAENVPPDETVLINPFLWGYGVYAGRDGGYWITPLTGVRTMPPNLLYGMGSKPDFERVNRISQAVLDHASDPPALHELMIQEGLRYVYTGRRGGALPPRLLAASGLFDTLYAQEGVWIFKRR